MQIPWGLAAMLWGSGSHSESKEKAARGFPSQEAVEFVLLKGPCWGQGAVRGLEGEKAQPPPIPRCHTCAFTPALEGCEWESSCPRVAI